MALGKINKRNQDIIICLILFFCCLYYIKAEANKSNWLTNIIVFGDPTYIYVNIGLYSSGDIVVEATSYPYSERRIFYGLKMNGTPLFADGPYYSHNVPSSHDFHGFPPSQFEAESLVIKLSSVDETQNGKEYFFSVGKDNANAEIFDFENGQCYKKAASDFCLKTPISLRHSLVSLAPTHSGYYYIFGILTANDEPRLTIQKHKFTSINDFENTQNINEAKIICQNCNEVNKSTSHDNIFFICNECKKNLCQLCRLKHDKTHNIIDYDEKFFICDSS
jgi:hypothetical protein